MMKKNILLFLLLCSVAALHAPQVAAGPGDGLVAHWNFDTDFSATYGGSIFDAVPSPMHRD